MKEPVFTDAVRIAAIEAEREALRKSGEGRKAGSLTRRIHDMEKMVNNLLTPGLTL